MFLTPPRQGTNPQILKLEFPTQNWGPKHKRKENKLKIINFFKINYLHLGTKSFY